MKLTRRRKLHNKVAERLGERFLEVCKELNVEQR